MHTTNVSRREEVETSLTTQKKMGHYRRGWEITKSSWQIFKLEKRELITVELISSFLTVLLLVAFVTMLLTLGGVTMTDSDISPTPVGIAIGIGFYFVMNMVFTFVSALFVHLVYTRLEGKDATISESWAVVKKRAAPLALFSIVNSVVRYLIDLAQRKLPLGGKIIAFLGGIAWTVATIFAIPVIVTSDEKLTPQETIKRSAGLIRRTWGEGVIAQFGIAAITSLIAFFYMLFFGALGALAFYATPVASVPVIAIGVIGLIAFMIVASILSAIAQAALFFYAKTGTEPAAFNKELLQSAMTPRKARKIFG